MSVQIEATPKKAPKAPLSDAHDRTIAMTGHDRSLLVEAGAGSGKTALMAGRIALMLAAGIQPKNIAAVTFTELAASELLHRVRDLVLALSEGEIPIELRLALPDGLTPAQSAHLAAASEALDDITCSTIHGFCQRLIKPYPVEADIDPGATVMDNTQADLTFHEITQSWLRDELSVRASSLLTELTLRDPYQTVRLVYEILDHLRRHRTLRVVSAPDPQVLLGSLHAAIVRFREFLAGAGAEEAETGAIVAGFESLAQELKSASNTSPADLVRVLFARPSQELAKEDGGFRAYKKKTKWQEAAKRFGLSKTDGDRLAQAAQGCYEEACGAWEDLREAAASCALEQLVRQVEPVMERFRAYKRASAQLDFNDLIFAARDLLRDHEPVRSALARRFAHVLVDEFQDTDPLQTEIFWRLCGEGSDADWTARTVRPGALFLVGDPKQAIYRFRGADVAAYVQAREALKSQDATSVLTISTNFRSRAPILSYVNERFRDPLSSHGQPGFTALDSHHPDKNQGPCVAALDIPVDTSKDKVEVDDLREQEALAVADLCARLIGSDTLVDRRTGQPRTCRPGDIALLAPTGTDLWRYERALEERGIAVATQAGKGLYRRQEIQDLVALTRVLADGRDTLALGALLRGPLVGLTEEELLDIVWALPRDEKDPEGVPLLTLRVASEHIAHPLARHVIEILKALRRQSSSTTPHDLLSQACADLRVRAVLMQRHQDQAERALANVDLFLHRARAYAVRGLRAFAEAMTAAWTDESRAPEGRPDAQEEAVALFTMHASKGLEWPIVIPINTMTQITAGESALTDRDGTFHCPIFKVRPRGYGEAREAEKEELTRERIRLWYVAATRACELLVLPRLEQPRKSSWMDLLDLHANLEPLDPATLPQIARSAASPLINTQTREIFGREAARIFDLKRSIKWLTPSREEDATEGDGAVVREEQAEIRVAGPEDAAPATAPQTDSTVQGGRERGIILHKLLEEVLTGETPGDPDALTRRAAVLIAEMRREDVHAAEVAGCVTRTLSLPQVAELRPRLQAEFPVYAAAGTGMQEEVCIGIADAIAFDEQGQPDVIIDWKSDVSPDGPTIEHYRRQVGEYLEMTGADRGLIVLVTSGTVIAVARRGA